jgi:hypothetical protein
MFYSRRKVDALINQKKIWINGSLGGVRSIAGLGYDETQLEFIVRVQKRGSVPDGRSRIIPEVNLVRHWAVRVLGIWRGEGLGEGWAKGGQFTSNLRPRWTNPVTARRVPSK